jgi:hypothetical protein
MRYSTSEEWSCSEQYTRVCFLGICSGVAALQLFANDQIMSCSGITNDANSQATEGRGSSFNKVLNSWKTRKWPVITEAHAEASSSVLGVPTEEEDLRDGNMHVSHDQAEKAGSSNQGPWVLDENMELVIHRRWGCE